MKIEALLRSLRQRVPWEVAQKVLSELDLPLGLGWDRTVTKISALTDLTAKDESDVARALKQHIICGEKFVRFYQLDDEAVAELRTAILAAPINASPFVTAYPGLCSESELAGLEAPDPELLAVEEGEDGTAAIFSSVRTLELRESLAVDMLPQPAAEALAGYDDVVGVKLIRWQALDVVWVPRHGSLIDVRIDFPRGMRHEAGEVACGLLTASLRGVLGWNVLGDAVNLFPLIDRLYRDDTEGRVVEIAFGTTTASLKHEKMRRRHLNLREETYHMAGKAGLGTPIEPFRLGVEWDVRSAQDVAARPEAQFHGSSRLALSAKPVLPEVVIRKCRGFDDFALVRSRLVYHLG